MTLVLSCDHGESRGLLVGEVRRRDAVDTLVSRHVEMYGCSCPASLVESPSAARAAAGGPRR